MTDTKAISMVQRLHILAFARTHATHALKSVQGNLEMYEVYAAQHPNCGDTQMDIQETKELINEWENRIQEIEVWQTELKEGAAL